MLVSLCLAAAGCTLNASSAKQPASDKATRPLPPEIELDPASATKKHLRESATIP